MLRSVQALHALLQIEQSGQMRVQALAEASQIDQPSH